VTGFVNFTGLGRQLLDDLIIIIIIIIIIIKIASADFANNLTRQ